MAFGSIKKFPRIAVSIYLHSRMITVRLPHVNLEEANARANALENAFAYVRFTTEAADAAYVRCTIY